MATVTMALYPLNPTASLIVGAALAVFNFLDGVFSLCVGCVVYTWIVVPIFGKSKGAPASASR